MAANNYTCVTEDKGTVHVLHNGVYSSVPSKEFSAYRRKKLGTTWLFSDSRFPFAVEARFEEVVPLDVTLSTSFSRDQLATWWWKHNKTGLLTSFDRLCALDQACRLFVKGSPP